MMLGSDTNHRLPAAHAGRHLILYDGVCGLCNGFVRFVLRRDRAGVFRFAALQSDLGRGILTRAGLDPDSLTSIVLVQDYGTGGERLLAKSAACLFVCGRLPWFWRLFTVCGIVPRALRDFGYDWVARHRYRWFGRYDACPLPSAEHRTRFLDP